jgi:hypothetical protein
MTRITILIAVFFLGFGACILFANHTGFMQSPSTEPRIGIESGSFHVRVCVASEKKILYIGDVEPGTRYVVFDEDAKYFFVTKIGE